MTVRMPSAVLASLVWVACGRSGTDPEELYPLGVEPTSLRFAASVGEVVTPVIVVLSGVERPVRSWKATTWAPWLMVDPMAATGVAIVRIGVKTRGLSPGRHSATVHFVAEEGSAPVAPVDVAVELILSAPGWTPLDGPSAGYIYSVAVDPADDRHVIAGNSRGRLFSSTDGGATFGFLALPTAYPIAEIELTLSGRGYAATSGDGVFVSEDHGLTWAASGLQNTNLSSLAVSAADDEHVLAIGGATVWRTVDGGDTWSPILTGECPGLVERNPETPGELFVSAANGVFYVTDGVTFEEKTSDYATTVTSVVVLPDGAWLVSHYSRTAVGLSTDQGANWTTVGEGLPGGTVRLAVDGPAVWAASGEGAFLSEDSGGYFNRIPFAFRPESESLRRVRAHPDGALFAHRTEGVLRHVPGTGLVPVLLFGDRVIDIRFVPATGRLYAATDQGGVFEWAADSGFESLGGAGMSVHELRAIAPDPRSQAHLCVGVYAEYTIQCTEDGGSNWRQNAMGLDGYAYRLVRALDDPDVLWTSTNVGLFRSIDNGLSFARMPIASEFSAGYLAVVSRDVVLASGGSTGYRLGRFDAATGNTEIILAGNYGPTLIRRGSDGSFWYGSSTLGLHRSTDGAASFTAWGSLPGDARDVEVDPTEPSHVYVGTDTNLFSTTDGGATWTELGAPFGVRTLDVDPVSGDLYVATDVGGIYRYVAP